MLVDEAVVDELEADIDEPARTSGEPDDAVDTSDGAGEVEPLVCDLRLLVRCLLLDTPSLAGSSLSPLDWFIIRLISALDE